MKNNFIELSKNGYSVQTNGLKMIFLQKTSICFLSKICVSVPKKFIKSAVKRNRVKRRIRNAYIRKFFTRQPSYLILFLCLKKELTKVQEIEMYIINNIEKIFSFFLISK